jgi:glycosyltransferase involved in cell wall biosynthesis
MLPSISFVIPLYNEEEILPHLIKRLNEVMESLPFKTEVVLINDGSTDRTAEMMTQLSLSDERFQSVFLSKNFGHQFALTAGLNYVRATEAVMVLDGDLQDPPELVKEFYEKFLEGYDVVYAVRKKRKEGLLKKFAYHLFYRLQKKLSFIDIPLDSGDFSLISRRVVDVMNKMPEESRFIRGIRTWIGFKQIGIEYERDSRFAGDSKYPLSKLIKLAYNGIFNFSELPIKFITNLGFFSILTAIIYLIITIYKKLVLNAVPEGFTALIFAIVLFSGVQLLSLGIIGEYVLRIFFQVKERPLFIVKNTIIVKEPKNG